MLHFPENRITEASIDQTAQQDAALGTISLERLLAAARRQLWPVAVGGGVGLLLGIAYLVSAVPLYTASTDILIDKGKSRTITELSDATTGVLQDDAEMLSQVELLKSINMARSVSEKLNLASNDAFMAGSPSLIGQAIRSILSVRQYVPFLEPSENLTPVDIEAREAQAAAILIRSVDVERVGKTYVLNLTYTSASPLLSAQIAQGYASAYLDDQLEAKYEATRRASDWLQARISELKTQSYNADLAVQKFRSDNNLISAGGTLVSEQQLTEINTQLVTAQAATAEAKARFEQIQNLIKSGRTDVVVNDALVSSTINSLREKYLDSSRRETEISNKLGPNHIQAVRLRDEMKEYERLIFTELQRIAESYQNAYNVSLSRQQSLEANLSGAVGINATANTTQVQLRELERESDTFKTLYTNFLQRYQETIQQQSFPVTEARVISAAAAPKGASWPKPPLILVLSLILGLGAGTAIGAWREQRERFLRVGDQVRNDIQQEFLGYLPIIAPGRAKGRTKDMPIEEAGGGLWGAESLQAYVRSFPLSPFAETLRNVKVAADLALPDQNSKVIGVVSCLPSEGKSTTSANLAILMAMQGAHTLLIDGDLRNPGVTRALARKPEIGLVETILEGGSLEAALQWDASGRLAVVPTVLKRRMSHSSELLTSAAMGSLLMQARGSFDYTVIDLPPAGPVIDAKAFAPRVDAFVFVVEWGRTSRQMVRNILDNNPGIRGKCLGILLSKVDQSKMRYYRSYGSSEYYSSRYQGYYLT